jgi:uncharacterized protein YeaO (DUF488 family)
VERLWPRGFTKERARVDLWLKDVAPSPELRKWFGHDPAKWDEFRRRYFTELGGEAQQAALDTLRQQEARGDVTLLYSAHDEEHNAALVLHEYLQHHPAKRRLRRAA